MDAEMLAAQQAAQAQQAAMAAAAAAGQAPDQAAMAAQQAAMAAAIAAGQVPQQPPQPPDFNALMQALFAQQQAHAALMQQLQNQMQLLAPVLQNVAAMPQAVAAAGQAAQQAAQATAAAQHAAVQPEQAAGLPTADDEHRSRLRANYQPLSLAHTADGREISGRLNMTVANWRMLTELAHVNNRVPPAKWVEVAVTNAIAGHVQIVALDMMRSRVVTDWATLCANLTEAFEPTEQKRMAANELEQLTMTANTVAALEHYVSRSRELHNQAADLVTEERKWSYFMRGLPRSINVMLSAIMEATKQEKTFEAASKLALQAIANKLQAPPAAAGMAASTSAGVAPMDMASMRTTGHPSWRLPQTQRNGTQPQQRGSGQRPNAWANGPPPGFTQRNASGRAGGSRTGRDTKGKGRMPTGTWRPQVSQQEKRRLIAEGKCLCCKTATDHGWQQCPRNPDNRGNA